MIDYQNIRRKTRAVHVGGVVIGGNSPISIQSMTNTDTKNTLATIQQVRELEQAGCEIVRITVPDAESAETISAIKHAGIRVPIVADIHFDYKAALACAERGVDKIRINPGNIGDEDRIKAVVDACKRGGIPIRIGVNGGSLEKHILAKHGAPNAAALCESALYHASLLEKFDFEDIVFSIKGSSFEQMIIANRLVAERCAYPIHIGVTEAGSEQYGMIKSAAGIGALLCDGIGDTMRVSLTADPVKEVSAAKSILNALEIKGQCGMNIVSCP
ncbi:MAG: flavodoxin-dependent (E)-4-hydroxy-3-methylbut-2-enyl-diphosphate synthase, partial [Clostridia bacterium]|nr:flavodoxin-dependent (E)-4-hydroxy-3-methylbut-2-enyl-diphosphate synthase [Clostridia bacterium]